MATVSLTVREDNDLRAQAALPAHRAAAARQRCPQTGPLGFRDPKR
jgi:hypothetical protein